MAQCSVCNHRSVFHVLLRKEENTEIHNQNYILREEEINARIKKFKEKGYSIDRLIQLAVKEKYDVVGEVDFIKAYDDSITENEKEIWYAVWLF